MSSDENICVKRVFGVKVHGDDNWIIQCKENSRDPHGVFSANLFEGGVLHVQIGNSFFNTHFSYNTFKKVVSIDKTLGDYL